MEKAGFYEFVIHAWEDAQGKEKAYTGLVHADSYKDAVEKVSKDFGEENIVDVTVSAIDAYDTYCFELDGEGNLLNARAARKWRSS